MYVVATLRFSSSDVSSGSHSWARPLNFGPTGDTRYCPPLVWAAPSSTKHITQYDDIWGRPTMMDGWMRWMRARTPQTTGIQSLTKLHIYCTASAARETVAGGLANNRVCFVWISGIIHDMHGPHSVCSCGNPLCKPGYNRSQNNIHGVDGRRPGGLHVPVWRRPIC